MSEAVVEILKFVGGSGVLIAAIAWLARSIMAHGLSKDLEGFKSLLQMQVIEHQVRFSRLHDRRAEVLATTYAHLQRVGDALRLYLNRSDSAVDSKRDEYLAGIEQAYAVFQLYFRPHRLFLPRQLADQIWEAAVAMQEVEQEFTLAIRHRERDPDRVHRALVDADREYQRRIPSLLTELERRFRESLGAPKSE